MYGVVSQVRDFRESVTTSKLSDAKNLLVHTGTAMINLKIDGVSRSLRCVLGLTQWGSTCHLVLWDTNHEIESGSVARWPRSTERDLWYHGRVEAVSGHEVTLASEDLVNLDYEENRKPGR